ncbi:uncharacterized protein LOC135471529 [Liolophura sinensis]|uniref:uncharacterized protein LOC135471529 n=1 Tax=Liolophura sinensis TaxID=3198878 RepID=UPI0031591A17
MDPLGRRCVFLFSALAICAGDIFTPEQVQQLDTFVKDVMSCSHSPGFTLTAVKGKEIFTRGYGKRDVHKGLNVTEETLFCIGSVTKAMTTTLLAKLLPTKFPQSSWDTKVSYILGDSFKFTSTDLTDHATLRDILSHRTGLVAENYGLIAGYNKSITRAYMAKKLRYLPSSQPLRYQFEYNNWMYFLAGYVAEVLAEGEESWEDLLTKHVLNPLGMDSTAILKDLNELATKAEMALPYVFFDGEFVRLSSAAFSIHPAEPAGAVCSSAKDMAKWLQFLLRSPKNIVNETCFNETMKPIQLTPEQAIGGLKRPTFPIDMYTFATGMGWFTGAYRGRHLVLHSGAFHSYTSLLWLFPDEDLGIFVSTNGIAEHDDPKLTTMMYASDLLLGETPWLNSTTACSFPEPWKVKSSKNSTEFSRQEVHSERHLTEYVGVYGNRFVGDMNVFINRTANDTLQLNLGYNIQTFLYATSEKDVFRWKFIGNLWFLSKIFPEFHAGNIQFKENNNGQIYSLVSSAAGKEFVFRKDVRFADTASTGESTYEMTDKKFTLALLTLFVIFSCQ